MKSVDALRKWADGLRGIWLDPNDHSIIVTTCDDMPPSIDCVSLREHVNGILDGIDREVDGMVRSLTIDAIPATSENMADAGWVRLPVDAEGVPIRIGDAMEGYQATTIEVGGLCWDGESWSLVDVSGVRWHDCAAFTHHYAPTVEDVLEQFLTAYDDADEGQLGITTRDVIAEYAAKLRLAGDE